MQRINNVDIKVPKEVKGSGKRVKGSEIRTDPFAIFSVVGRKKSGKTVVIENILARTLPPKVPVIIICPTIDTDAGWIGIKKRLEKKRHPIYEYYGIKDPDTGENNLRAIMRHMEELNREDPNHIKTDTPKYVLIMDDCGTQMRDPSVYQFMLKNRHEKCAVILSSQNAKNIMPNVRQQVGVWLLFPKLNEKDLQTIYDDSDPACSFDDFKSMYHKATAEQYSFFYFTPHGDFRTKFDMAFKAPAEKKDEKSQKGGFSDNFKKAAGVGTAAAGVGIAALLAYLANQNKVDRAAMGVGEKVKEGLKEFFNADKPGSTGSAMQDFFAPIASAVAPEQSGQGKRVLKIPVHLRNAFQRLIEEYRRSKAI